MEEKSIYIKKGKNIIELNHGYKSAANIIYLLSNSKNNSESIYFYNKNTNKVLKTKINLDTPSLKG